MAVSQFIKAVKDEARNRPRSTDWYKEKIKEFGVIRIITDNNP